MSPPDFTKRNTPDPQFDPVTGAPLLPGPAAYSAVDPTQGYPAQGYQEQGYPAQPYPTQQFPAQQYPAQQYPPGYAAPGYAAPGYPPAGQPPPGYPAGYPAGYAAPGYAAPGYQLVPMYPALQRPTKPGGATAAAVLAYVQSGFVLIGSIVTLSGSAGLDDFNRGNNLSSELTVIGILTLLAGGLLIAGATTLLNRKPALLLMGNGLSIAVSLYYVIRLMDFVYGVALWVPILFAVLPIISTALACTADVRTWARARTFDRE